MLQQIRDRSKGVFAYIIVGLITIPFALWGIQEYLGVGGAPAAATVNGVDIPQDQYDMAIRESRLSLREKLGDAYRADLIDDQRMREEVLNQLIRQILITQQASDLKLAVGDDEIRGMIRSIPAFQRNGQFDVSVFQRVLRQQGQTEEGFVQNLRYGLVNKLMARAVEDSAFVTTHEFEDQIRVSMQKRDLRYLLIPASHFIEQANVSDDEIKKHYDARPDDYMSPERVKIAYVEFTPEMAGGQIVPDEDEIAGLYEARKSEFLTVPERRASHILIELSPSADAAAASAAQNRAAELKTRLDNGEDFAELAASESDEAVSAQQGGDLGYFEQGMMMPEFDETVMKMSIGEISDPVRTEYGLHIIKLTDIRKGKQQTLDDVRDQLIAILQGTEGQNRFYELSQELVDQSYEANDSLEPAASAIGVSVNESDWFTRDSGTGIATEARVRAAAFGDDVLNNGNNSEVLELTTERLVVVRVLDHEAASRRPLADVRDEIAAELRLRKAQKLAEAEATRIAADLQAGKDIGDFAADAYIELKSPGMVGRNAQGVDRAILLKLFRMGRPLGGEPGFAVTQLDAGDAVVVGLYAIKDGSLDGLDARMQTALRSAASRRYAQDAYSLMLDELQDKAEIKINDQ